MFTHIPLSKHILAALVAAASLVACAEPDSRQEHSQHHAGQAASGPGWPGPSAAHGGMMGGAATGSDAGRPGAMQHMDKEAMCTRYRGMRDAPSGEARQAMMDPHMRAMSPEMRMQHMEMMRKHCQ